MTFKELFQAGQCSISAIDTWSEIWHKRTDMGQSLQTFLGLTNAEYQAWLMQGNAGLAQLLTSGHMSAYETVHLGWDELTAQLQEIVDAELGPGFTVALRRQDYYYWDMQLETSHKMNEALSEKICKRLDLRDVDVLVFLYDDWVDNNSLCGLLSKLTHREVTSSHADDHGVWIICKSLIQSSPEFTAHLLARCEQRLRCEITNRHYSLVNPDTACHQLFGFMEALVMLGLLERDKLAVVPNHFKNEVYESDLQGGLRHVSDEPRAALIRFEYDSSEYALTEKEIEAAYRYQLRQHRLEDAKRNLSILAFNVDDAGCLTDAEVAAKKQDFERRYGVSLEDASAPDMLNEYLRRFENRFNCDYDENTQWEAAIEAVLMDRECT